MYHMYVSCHVATTIVIMNVVYFVYLLLSFLFFFRSFFLLQPFLSASSVWLQVNTQSPVTSLLLKLFYSHLSFPSIFHPPSLFLSGVLLYLSSSVWALLHTRVSLVQGNGLSRTWFVITIKSSTCPSNPEWNQYDDNWKKFYFCV